MTFMSHYIYVVFDIFMIFYDVFMILYAVLRCFYEIFETLKHKKMTFNSLFGADKTTSHDDILKHFIRTRIYK